MDLRAKSSLDTEYCDLLDRTIDLLKDYYDSDDLVETNGAEALEYEAAGMEPLPRNASAEWREELLFIPEIRQLFPLDADGRLTAVRLSALSGGRNYTMPSLFSATPEMLKRIGGLEDQEVAELYQAILNYRNNGSSIASQLDETLLSKLRNNGLSSVTGNNISVVIRPATPAQQAGGKEENMEKFPSRRLAFSFSKNSISQ